MKQKLKKAVLWLKENAKKLLHMRESLHEIALGVAIGVFIGIFPTFGFGGLVVLGIAPVVRFNVPAAFIGGTLLSNPFLSPLWIFLSCLIVGIDIHSIKSSEESIGLLIKHYSGIAGLYVLGNALISSAVAVISYGLTRGLLAIYRARRRGNKKDERL